MYRINTKKRKIATYNILRQKGLEQKSPKID
jgi:hypothetical protein